jgi:hypothetical protein
MNIIKQIASRGLIYVLAVAILGSGLLMSSDTTTVEAEVLGQVFLTNKGTGKTTEVSPASSRIAPASRANASPVYVTMTDVDTANGVKNSHILNANKVVITVTEPDFNSKVAVTSADPANSGPNNITAADWAVSTTHVIEGSAGNPVIDTDSDGVLDDEIKYGINAEGAANTFNDGASNNGFANAVRANSDKILTVSVANGDSATATATKPMITVMIATAITGITNADDFYAGYYSSAVNTFKVKAWSTVQLEANASNISVVETGRNTGVFEAEFVVSDTEGINDGSAVASTVGQLNQGAAPDKGFCGSPNASAAAGTTAAADGRWDASDGVDADCDWLTLDADADMVGASNMAANTPTVITGTYTLKGGLTIYDSDGDGSILDEFYFVKDGTAGTDIAATNQGYLTTVTVCAASAGTCDSTAAADRTLTLTASFPTAITDGTADQADVMVPVVNNVVDFQKVDTNAADGVTAADAKTGRVGSDTASASVNQVGLGAITDGTILSNVHLTGVDRTPIVEAQANATITVQYVDATDNASTASTKVTATVSVDSSGPTAAITSPANGNSSKERQPTFVGSMTDIGSGLDVSTGEMYIDMLDETALPTNTTSIKSSHLAGSWLGGAGSVDLMQRYVPFALTLDNSTTMVDGVTSITWTVATSANIPCDTVEADTTKYAAAVDNTGASTHTDKARAAKCLAALSDPDVSVDYSATITDLAGNRGFSDSAATTDTNSLKMGDSYSINIDEKKPAISTSSTGKYWDSASLSEKSDSLDKIVVTFDDELSATDATAFQVTLDAGTVLTPLSAEIGTKGTTAAGVAFDKRRSVYLTLPSNMASNDTPKVKVIGDVTDLAGNSTKSGSIANATDSIKPTLTVALSGGSGTGTGSNSSDKLTKSAMTVTITTSEVLSSPPTVSVFNELYGTGGTVGAIAAGFDLTEMGAGTTEAFTVSTQTVVDSDKDGSLADEITLGLGSSESVSATQLTTLAVSAVTLSGEDTIITLINNGSTLVNGADFVSFTASNNAALSATSQNSVAEGTVSAVAQDSLTYTAAFAGSGFTDTSTTDMKSIYVSATDASTSPNTQTIGHRDHGNAAASSFRLDKTAPTLATLSSSTTLPRPYVIIEFTDNSDVTVVTASFGGDDVLAKLATTNNKKYFMIPDADLTTKIYAVKAKGTDLAGNKGAEASYNLTVTSRKDYKATILAGWNLMSFPSDPVSNGVGSVFTNAGIDQVVGYNAMAKGSPWAVATKDSASGTFSGGLETITSGNGYWIHSTEFATQSVALTGPEGPSASAPPSIESIGLASGWNLIGVTDATKALTQANEGTQYKQNNDYLGGGNGSSVTKAYEYNTTGLTWVELNIAATADTDAGAVNIGEAFWVFAKPGGSGLLTPIVP